MKFEVVIEKKARYLDDLKSEIESMIKDVPHLLETNDYGDCTSLCFGGENAKFEKAKTSILERCIEYLLYDLKLRFYSENLRGCISSNRLFLLSRVLVFSELDKEVEELLYKVLNTEKLVLSGVRNFLVGDFLTTWKAIAAAVNESMAELSRFDVFDGFIKSISGTIKSKEKLVYLFCGRKSILLSGKLERLPCTIMQCESLSCEERIISSLVENYPMNVAIYQESDSEMICEALDILFDARNSDKRVKSG